MVIWAGGFSGIGFDRAEFRKWLRAGKKPPYQRIVVHNTDAPFITPPYGSRKRLAALRNYYENDRDWSGGPDFFVFGGDDKVYVGSPLGTSIGCLGWNGNSFHVETEGNYKRSTHQDPTVEGSEAAKAWATTAWVYAEILDWMGWPADKGHIMLHKEAKTDGDPRTQTTHDCPGELVNKTWLIEQVIKAGGVPVEDVKAAVAVTLWVKTPGDTLNFRQSPPEVSKGKTGPVGRKKAELPHGLKVTVLESHHGWSHVRTPGGYEGWVSSHYLTSVDPHIQPPPAEPVPTPKPIPKPDTPPPPPGWKDEVQQPGLFKYSQFAVDWAKRFEGLRLKAYWDKADWAIGYGHNNGSGVDPEVDKDTTITEAEAVAVLMHDLELQLKYLNHYVSVPLTQGQIDALCLHLFQQGPGNFREGKLRPLVNGGHDLLAKKMLEEWPTANAGLVRRRKVEAQIFAGEKPTKW